ncbi:hypothetical protein GCM10010103_61760 [Streptomyces paradoxus]|uniref:8-oxo-dGTP pyrophosphatase MutT (NUDIX family) n=1 Tax=Streptomyces paradoxus TaxID=66375 RepID=A0A7W9TIE3_9ACTN|nr:NUDIX domain-containing protein [Streptomyces paradoxus]MBB6081224.1 8-oxo-dGTP pyrophosphatase MutT (NUDIX family) [Streptomyces paradoxus]
MALATKLPGESHEQAALRELREETGQTNVSLGPEIWQDVRGRRSGKGVACEVRQRYYVARVPAFDVDTSAFEDSERAAISGHRWWTAAGLAATSDVLRPAELPELPASLLMDGPPAQPITVDG